MNKIRAELFLTSFILFGLQILFVRGFKLFFTQVDAQALLPWSFLGLALGCFLPLISKKFSFSKEVRPALSFVGAVLLLYALSCLFIIHTFSAFFVVLLANMGLGYCLGSFACNLEAYKFYAYDFLGGIFGAIVAFILPTVFSIESTYLLFTLIAFIPMVLEDHRSRIKIALFSLLGIFTAVLFLKPAVDLTVFGALYQRPQDYDISPARHGQLMLKKKEHSRVYSSWSASGKLEVYEKSTEPGLMPEYKFHLGNIENFELTPYEPRTVGSFGAGKKALVIGAGGGLEMRFLRDQGFKDITAIEINEDIYNLMLGKFSESSGKIFNESRYIRGEGRNFVEAHNDLYDVIVINYIGAVGGMLSSSDDLSENYLFTGEAFETYYKRLKPGGLVIIGLVYSKHLFPNPLLLRTTEAAAWVLRNHNENPKEQMWILGDKRKSISMEDRAYRGIVVLRKGPLQPQEESFIDDMKTGLYFPDSYFVSKPSDSKGVLASLLVSQEELTREAVNSSKIEQAREQEEVDVSVVSDKRPYFFFYESQASFPMRQSQGIFWATCILMGIIIVLLLKDKSGILKESSQGWLLGISGLLGFTYGLLEIALLNAFTIAFSSTLWNFGMMVFGLLLGSVLAGFAGGLLSRVIKLALIVVASFSLILLFWFDLQKFILAWEGEVARSVILIGMTLAISFGLSMLYPQLLKQCEGREPRMPGLLLGVNSAFFILGCIVCRYTAVNLTLRHAFLIAGAVYLLATALFYLKKDFKSAK